MIRQLVIDESATEEAEAQASYYLERAGMQTAMQFGSAIEAVYRRLLEGRFVGVNHPSVHWRLPLKRLLLDRFPFAIVFYVEEPKIYVVALEALRKQPGYWRSRLQ
jgi:plasmid stabilization system protein ParE